MPGVSQPNFRGNHERNNGFNRHRNKTRTSGGHYGAGRFTTKFQGKP
nr:MAG TPA_asm: hypothetical protein [Caudoviricetes sp.]